MWVLQRETGMVVKRGMGRGFDGVLRGSKWALGAVLKHHYILAVVFFGVIGATYFLLGRVSKGFIPEVDNDSMTCTVEAAQSTSYYKMVEYISKGTEIIPKDPNIESFMTRAG